MSEFLGDLGGGGVKQLRRLRYLLAAAVKVQDACGQQYTESVRSKTPIFLTLIISG